jgi:hypothetical protein
MEVEFTLAMEETFNKTGTEPEGIMRRLKRLSNMYGKPHPT